MQFISLNNKLNLWVSKSLISDEQRQNILAFEAKGKSSRLLGGLFLLGVFVISLGVIGIIASNWNQIPCSVKLSSSFLLLLGLGLGAFHFYGKGRTKTYESFIFGFFMMIGASIGLISQVFQLSGDVSNAIFFWSILSLPLLFLTKAITLPIVLPVMFLSSTTYFFDIWAFLDYLFDYLEWLEDYPAFVLLLTLGFFGLWGWFFRFLYYKTGGRVVVLKVCYVYSMILAYLSAFVGISLIYIVGKDNIIQFLSCFVVALGFFSYMGWLYYQRGQNYLLNMIFSFIALSFFTLYIKLADDLLNSGIGLVLTGIVIILLGYGLSKVIHKTQRISKETTSKISEETTK